MDDVKLTADDENIVAFTISETWLNSNICIRGVSTPGYHFFRRDKT